MNFIHLVKQVPDITNIPADAWDREKGTLKRNKLDNRMNLLDLHALTLADNIREKGTDDNARIISLTMGPPSAETVLKDSLARAGDDAVLLTDRTFAGADTIATAYSLACGVQKIEKELFKNDLNYVILAGMQSVDGDTAQVPAQISEVLDIDLIAYVTGFDFDANGQLLIKRIGPAGMEVLRPKRFPVMLTVTDCTEPLYPKFSRTRQTRLKPQAFHHWTAADIAADPEQIGAKGSKTQVVNIFSFQQTREKTCRFISDFNELPAALKSTLANKPGNGAVEKTENYALNGHSPAYTGEIWVFAEAHGNEIAPAGLELLNKSRELAAVLNVPVAAILLGNDIEPLAETLISYGADKVYLVENKELDHFFSQSYKQVITELIKTYEPQIVLFGATPLGRELAPRVAFATSCGLTADCTKLELGERKDQYGILQQTRPALGGNIMATIITKSSPAQMASVRPGVFKAMEPDPQRQGEIIKFNPI
ncbi:hypothetical protein KAH55_04895, partial [bacterium]|nr:hypothetical protein [bacterium]